MERLKNLDLGIFDSGIGGLTVLRVLLEKLPVGLHFHYFADTARVPYGSKPPETIKKYVGEILDFFGTLNIAAIATACNTSDSLTGDDIRESLDIPYFSIIEPVTTALGESVTPGCSVAIIGTENTVRKSLYLRKLINFSSVIRMTQKACPLFVPLVEEGIWEGRMADTVTSFYLKEIKRFGPDYLIMGCTHYPFLRKAIAKYMGDKVKIVDPADALSDRIEAWAGPRKGLERSEVSFYVSGDLATFKTRMVNLLGENFRYELYNVDLSEIRAARTLRHSTNE